MNNSEEILNELNNTSPLLVGLRSVNVFQLPDGYFDKLDERITDFVISNTYGELNLNKTNVHQVPEGYFDSLSTSILAKIKKLYPETMDEELRNLSPILYSLKDKNVFKVPAGYFEYFSEGIITKLKSATAKIVVMKPRSSWMKIAAAAVVTGVIAFTSLQLFNNSSNSNTSKPIAASTAIPNYVKESFQFKTVEQLDNGIAKLSDDEIIKYLEKNGNVMDNELLLSNTDVSELPAQTEYLLDVNTLNSYLDKIEGNANDGLKN